MYFSELEKYAPWTNWIKTNSTSSGHFEQRFRYMCKANVPEVSMIKTSYVKTHTRFCFKNDGTCHKAGELRNTIDPFYAPLSRAVRSMCKYRRQYFRDYCKCRTLGIFLVCSKCRHR